MTEICEKEAEEDWERVGWKGFIRERPSGERGRGRGVGGKGGGGGGMSPRRYLPTRTGGEQAW